MIYTIGLVGETSSGKTIFRDIILKYMIPEDMLYYSFSGPLREILADIGVEASFDKLQKLPTSLFKHLGHHVLAEAVKSKALKNTKEYADNLTKNCILILDGIRMIGSDVPMLRSMPNNILLYITATQPIRFRRLLARNQNSGDTKLVFSEFQQKELQETAREIPKIGALADWTIHNNGTAEHFEAEIKRFLKEKLPAITKEGI